MTDGQLRRSTQKCITEPKNQLKAKELARKVLEQLQGEEIDCGDHELMHERASIPNEDVMESRSVQSNHGTATFTIETIAHGGGRVIVHQE